MNDCWRYVDPDSSPQLGYNWLVLREDRFTFPHLEYDGVDKVCAAEFNKAYSTRMCLLSVIGRGRGTLVAKAFKMSSIHKMESKDEDMEQRLREQVYGLTADQGTEKGCADIDSLQPRPHDGHFALSPKSRMYPNALYMPEHLHIIFNALQHAVEALPTYRHWLNRLRSVERFLPDKSIRRLFMATCMEGHPEQQRLKSYSTVHIDWRWEMLSRALDQLIPIAHLLRERFDLNKLLSKVEDGTKVDAEILREAHSALQIQHFLQCCEMVRSVWHVLERAAHRLEGCECHRSIWISKAGSAAKKRRLQAETGYDHCYLKGR